MDVELFVCFFYRYRYGLRHDSSPNYTESIFGFCRKHYARFGVYDQDIQSVFLVYAHAPGQVRFEVGDNDSDKNIVRIGVLDSGSR